ncbi:acetolactate synthase small subunit [archaeon D22]|nr:acetolactate synthase small subunit [archaeon D22]
MKKIIGIKVENEPGILTRIAGMFVRRDFNIETITVGKTREDGISRIIISVDVDEKALDQMVKQLYKVMEVQKVTIHDENSIISELCLVKVAIPNDKARQELLDYVEVYKVKIVDITVKSAIFQVVGTPDKIDSFLELVKKFGIKSVSRTGLTAMQRKEEK